MDEKILPRQLCALTFCAFSVPAFGLLPRAGWLWAGLAAAVCAALLAALTALCRKKGGSLAQLAGTCRAGRGCLWLCLLWNFLILGAAARYLCGVYPGSGAFPLTGALLLLLAAYASGKGVSAVARVSAICFFFFLVLYGLLLGFSLPQMNPQWLRPVTRPRWLQLPAALCPVCALYLTDSCRSRGRLAGWLAGGTALALLAALVTAGCVCPEVAGAEPFAFYTMSKSISLFGTMERFEALVSAALTAGAFCLLALLCLSNAAILRAVRPQAEKYAPIGNFLLGGASIWLIAGVGMSVLAAGSAIFWGILPLLILSVAKRKKY